MSDVKFIIDKSRGDSFYHYTKTDSNNKPLFKDDGTLATGWGLYSYLKDEDEKAAWIEAVNKFNSDTGIKTPCALIKDKLHEFKDAISLDDAKFPNRRSYLMPALGAAIQLVAKPGEVLCDDEFIEQLLQACGGAIPTKENIAKYALETVKINLEIDCHILLYNLEKLGINGFVISVVDLIESLVDKYFGVVDAVYNEYSRIASGVIRLYRKSHDEYGLPQEERQSLIKEFLEKLKEYGEDAVEIVLDMLCIDMLLQLIDMLKNIKTLAVDIWKSMIQKFKDIIQVFTDIDIKFLNKDEIIGILTSLLFAVGALIGAVLAMNCANEQEIDNAIKSLCDAERVSSEDELKEKIKDDTERYRNELSEHTIIYKNAVNDSNGYSLNKNPEIDVTEENTNNTEDASNNIDNCCICKVSMCETTDATDTSDWFNNFEYPELVIVEVDLRKKCLWSIKAGDHINLNDIIGEIEDTPVRSIISCDVIEVQPSYFIGRYTEDTNILNPDVLSYTEDDLDIISNQAQELLNEKIKEFQDNPYDAIIDKYKKYAYTCDFLKDYISFYRFPELAVYTREHTDGDAIAISTDDFIEKYEDAAQKILDDYHDDVKKTCKKSNVKKYAKKGQIPQFKKLLDKKKDDCIKDIMTLYNNNPGEMKYCSKGRICDFYLYSHYVEYINSDKFDYDEENPYIVRLADKLNEFIGRRIRLELNKDNLEGLITSFNELCQRSISLYWPFKDIDYYTKLSELFKYDTYTDTEVIAEGTLEDNISLYKRVLNYLKAITKFTKSDNYNPDNNDVILEDVQGFLNKQEQQEEAKIDKEKVKFEKLLKKIAYRFAGLRKIELSLNNTNISTYASDNVIKDFQELRISKGEVVNEYTENTKYKYKDVLYKKESILGPYFEMMKKITLEEIKELKSLYKDAMQYYLDNKDSINSCEDLFKLREINWPGRGILYKENTPVHYYLFNADTPIPPKSLEELEQYEEAASIPEEYKDDYDLNDMMSSPNTAYGVDSIVYWLRYCGVATIVNLIPIYWATGLNVGSPIPLPIIYLPLVPIKVSSMVIVIGIGICGVALWPMILFVNMGPLNGTVIIPIDLAIDYIQQLVEKIKAQQSPTIKGIVNPLVKLLDNEINQCIEEEQRIDFQISELQGVSVDYRTKFNIDSIFNRDTTSKGTYLDKALTANASVPNMIEAVYGPNARIEETEEERDARLQEQLDLIHKNTEEFETSRENLTVDDLYERQKQLPEIVLKSTATPSYTNITINSDIIKTYTSAVHTTPCSRGRAIEYLVFHYNAGSNSNSKTGKEICEGWAKTAEWYETETDIKGNTYQQGYYKDSNGNKVKERKASADFVVDDAGQYQYNPDPLHYICWAIGDSKDTHPGSKGGSMYGQIKNSNSISIVICSSNTSSGMTKPNDEKYYFTDAVLAQARSLGKKLMLLYGIPIENVYRHYDVSGKICPGVIGWNANSGDESKWQEFKNSLVN